MQPIECRRYRREDAAGWMALHKTHFPPIAEDFGREWSHRDDVTVSVAARGDEVVGVVPFHLRDFRIGPQAVIRAGFEHAVMVEESLRDQGIGSRMMTAAKQFLPDLCDVMMVYRGAERSDGYRFYARTGHHDLTYLRPTVLEQPQPAETAGVRRGDADLLLQREAEFLAVYHSAYRAWSGYPVREPGYWSWAFSSAIYNMHPVEFIVLYLEDQGQVTGYAVAGLDPKGTRLTLLEIATADEDQAAAGLLVEAVGALAAENRCPAHTYACDLSPYTHTLWDKGFRPSPRGSSSMMIMAHVLDPAALAGKVWQENAEARPLEVSIWTPEREAVIHPSDGTPSRSVTLEMKEDALTRLLLARLDLVSAVRQELVTVAGAQEGDVEAIARALPFAPWVYHQIDYI